MGDGYHAIGRPHWRVDGIGKVTGRARFAADLRAPGMLVGKVLIARRPHARIVRFDLSRAAASPGVRALLTAADLPLAKFFGVVIQNQPILAVDRVRHYGDGVVMVAAETDEAAEMALELVEIEYEDLPVLSDPEEAMRPGAPLIHPHDTVPDDRSEEDRAIPNLCVHHRIRHGDTMEGFARAALILERTYRTQHIEHAYLEPEAVLAEMTEDGGVRVTGSIQNVFSTRRSLAAVLGLDLARVTVKHAFMGGSFGGKDEVMTQMACRAALLARATGRPVKMVNTREQSMAESYKRHPYVLHYKIGTDKDGLLTAVQARIVADAGAYASMSPFVTWRSAVQSAGMYECANVHTDVYAIYTNNVYTGAMRGFGSPQVNFAVESLMDELAAKLGLDPVELRLRNAYRRGSVTPTGQVLDHEVSTREVIARVVEATGWAEKRRAIEEKNLQRTDGRRGGIGLACSYRGVSLGAEGTDAVGAIVSVQSDGSVIVSAGLTDMGQGVSSTLSLIVAEVLGLNLSRVRFFNVHTGRVPDSGPTVASRSTIMGGRAAQKAAEAVRDTLYQLAAEELGVPSHELRGIDGGIYHGPDPGRGFTFDQITALAFSRGKPLLGFGWFKSPTTSWHEEKGTGQAYFTFVYGANVAEVEVDIETGMVDVLKITAAHDLGRAISPAMARSQIGGGIAMGCGMGLLENYDMEGGVPLQRNLDEYLVLTSMDMPEVEAILVENPDPIGPFGAKSIGEPATEIAAPAVTNAIAHATGRPLTDLPAGLELVFLGRKLTRPAGKKQ
jgi:CO/xanthine dehydrogenase Mo-binding subunit